jgi:hypothetical protein
VTVLFHGALAGAGRRLHCMGPLNIWTTKNSLRRVDETLAKAQRLTAPTTGRTLWNVPGRSSTRRSLPVARQSVGRVLIGIAVGVLALASCGSSNRSGGDPGNHRLHELANDPIFAKLPSGAVRTELTQSPAAYVTPAFQGAGWDGPSVILSFTCSLPIREVYRFFDGRATAAGWHALASGYLHVTDRWEKQFRDGAVADIGVAPEDPDATTYPRSYRLSGGISLP